MKHADWYFDFISPFSYLQCERLPEITADIEIRCKPVLFAGLLKHHGQLGPAEIPSKRRFTYRFAQWLADQQGITFTLPPVHPFNPLAVLRLAIAAGSDLQSVSEIFRFIWAQGRSIDDGDNFDVLANRLGIADARTKIADAGVKQELIDNTQQAIDRDVFGVPSFVVDDTVFWGADALDFFLAYCHDPRLLDTPAMRRIDDLPVGTERPRKEEPGSES